MASQERSTPDRILDAYEKLLVVGGASLATLDAVASEASVSKGGLLYHFASKDELRNGMLERLKDQAAEDLERMRTAKDGPVLYYLYSSVDSGSDFDRALIATACIAFESDPEARAVLAQLRNDWFAVLKDHLDDEALARTIQLIGDGLYFDDTTGMAHKKSLEHIREVLRRLNLAT